MTGQIRFDQIPHEKTNNEIKTNCARRGSFEEDQNVKSAIQFEESDVSLKYKYWIFKCTLS